MNIELKGARQLARDIISNAYSPYSGFPVGAVAVSEDGRLFAGVNVENASYGLTSCAERNAVYSAVAAGVKKFSALLLLTETEEPATPCGACRQVIAEFFSTGAPVVCETLSGKSKTYTVEELLPDSFSL